jgi:hypothetical protein
VMNPTLADLIGGIQSVTLGDEEARRRGTQKSILERKSPPTFDIVVEIQGWDRVAIHPDVGEAVDALLRGLPSRTEVRWLDEQGEVRKERVEVEAEVKRTAKGKKRLKEGKKSLLFLFGVNRVRLGQIAREMHLDLEFVDNLRDASILVTSKNYYRRKPQPLRDAESAHIPIYVLKSNTPPQMRQLLSTIHPEAAADKADSLKQALSEAKEAVTQVKEGDGVVELSPQSAYVRRLQHLIAQRSHLSSHSLGRDPERRVRIYKEQS